MRRFLTVAAISATAIGFGIPAGGEAQTEIPAPGPDCSGYGHLAKKAYSTQRWWKLASRQPATKGEDQRLDAFIEGGCPSQVRHTEKQQYAAYYRKVIAPEVCGGQRWANCAVATCESGLGSGGNILYGFLDYWSAIEVLPVKGNRTGTRFAPSASAASKLEQDVVAAAAFKFGPTPSTCAS